MSIFNTKRVGTNRGYLVFRCDSKNLLTFDKNIFANKVYQNALMTCLKSSQENKWYRSRIDIFSVYLYASQ